MSVKETHGHTHQHYATQVLNIFRIERLSLSLVHLSVKKEEVKTFTEAGYDKLAGGGRLVLWHFGTDRGPPIMQAY
ncbi:hypothetical protein JB92DRAFT_3031243 [Gautieria morchelliformis]|nr:hypothetical protein JB92DRAFT_3031243 [Gautieria morchelliformis]